MIQISTKRFGPIVVGATVLDTGEVVMAWGFTEQGASNAVCVALDHRADAL